MMLMPRRNNFDLDDFFDDPFFRREERRPHPLMKTDIRENENSYIIDVDLPGFDKENIKIDVTDGYLNINASVNNEEKEDKDNYLRKERFSGECSRSFYIGDDIKVEDIKANFRNGILSLTVPKVNPEDEAPEKKYIEIGD